MTLLSVAGYFFKSFPETGSCGLTLSWAAYSKRSLGRRPAVSLLIRAPPR